MAGSVYLNGSYVPLASAGISVLDHGFLYGDGVFEGIRAYGGTIFRLEEHLQRLYASAKSLLLEIPHTLDELREIIKETCRRNAIHDGYIRVVVSRGPGDLGLDPRKCPTPTVLVIADTITLYPPELYERGLEIGTSSVRRSRSEMVNPQIKSLNYLGSILAKIEGNQRGYAEVVMLTEEGYVAECTADNLFIVRGGRVETPAPHLGILLGITRAAVLEIAAAAGHEVRETVFTRHELWNADEVFLTGTAAEVVPVVSIDARTIGDGQPGPVTRDLAQRLRELAKVDGVPIG